jgi:protease I
MSKIAILLTDMFEDVEYTTPVSAFDTAGHKIIHVGLNKGDIVKGKKKDTPVKIDQSIDKVTIDDFDALFIPGGYSPDKLRVNDTAVDFVSDFVKSGKPVLTICHGPQVLISADALKNRKITGWKSIIQDIKNAGAEFIDNEVVVDDNLVSSRSPRDLTAFIDASLDKLS